MKMILRLAVVAALSVMCLASASAFPPYGYGGPPGPPYGYGYRYGFGPYGWGGRPFYPRYAYGYRYGFRPYGSWRGLPNGTGYRGRGTLTGGPVGGYPSRN